MSDESWPWKRGSEKHKAILAERQELLSMFFDGAFGEDEWYRLACIRGLLDAIEEADELKEGS